MRRCRVRLRPLRPALIGAALLSVVGTDMSLLADEAAAGRDALARPAATALARSTPAQEQVPAVAAVAPLRRRHRADVLILTPATLSPARLRQIRHAAEPRHLELASSARVRIGRGRTTALGVDASSFRAYTPKGTAEVNPLWQAVASGDAAVAHAVAAALAVPLGGTVRIRRHTSTKERVGALATTGLPGIGVVLSADRAQTLGLTPRSAVILSLRSILAAPDVAAKLRRLPGLAGASVTTVRRFVPVTRSWVAPAAGMVSSPFGRRAFPLNPARRDFHPGVDIAAPLGAPIWAAAAGTVLYAGPASGFGNEIVLLHDGGVTTVYGHMSRLLVTSGAVRAGQPIALVGSEGDSTGPHLHFEVRIDNAPVDPIAWLRSHGVPISQ